VLTGIGHEQDETIADLVAHTRLKTPTAAAEFLIDSFRHADEKINELSVTLFNAVTEKVDEVKEKLNRYLYLLKPVVKERLATCSGNLRYQAASLTGVVKQLLVKQTGKSESIGSRLKTLTKEFLTARKHTLEVLGKKNDYLNPFLILNRGYSITYHQGRALKNPAQVAKDDIIVSRLAGGIIKSKTI
jgi:exodeoxyribonuclease VII large subunit